MIQNDSIKKPVSGIILSGGFSNRFQQTGVKWQDKALLPINGESLLERSIKKLAEICSEIIVMSSNNNQQFLYQKVVDKLSVNIQEKVRIKVDDTNLLCKGPSRGLLSTMNYLTNKYAIVIPVDVPHLKQRLFHDLLINLGENTICVPYWSSGKIEPLIFAFNVQKIKSVAPFLAFNAYSRADDIFRLASSIKFLHIEYKKRKSAEKIFASINNQQEYKQVKKSLNKIDDSLFDFKKSIIVKKPVNRNIHLDLLTFFKQTNYLKLTTDVLNKGINYSELFSNKNNYFFAGFIHTFLLRLASQNFVETHSEIIEELIRKNIDFYLSEAKQWENHKINFLALHAYLDAYSIVKQNKSINNHKFLHKKITNIRNKMHLQEKQHNDFSFSTMFTTKLPGFLEKAKKIIRDAESAYNKEASQYETDFLWDHSYRVGRIAYYIAIHEGINPFIPTIAAILHDAGKFVIGKYHSDDVSEETHSSKIAGKLLSEEGLSKQEIEDVQTAISRLYLDQIPNSINSKIVYDADRLEKLGVFGVANYFTKMTLRGTNLSTSIIRFLSRELTYASTAPKTLLTKTAKQLANRRSIQTLKYFNNLLLEFDFYGLGKYYTKEFTIKDGQAIQLVIPEKCQNCTGNFVISLNTKEGIKCERAVATYECTKCDFNYSIEFCLPLIIHKE